MDTSLYERFAQVEREHWWFQGRREVLAAILRDALPAPVPGRARQVFDIGSGTGESVDMLREFGEVTAMDAAPQAVRYCRDRHQGAVRVLLGRVPEDLPADQRFDLVTGFDVIEHLANDAAALRALGGLLTPGGLLVVTVPAFPLLWSGHDVLNEHHRRYRRARLDEALRGAGLRVRRISYFNTALFAPVLAARLAERLRTRIGPPRAPRSPHLAVPPAPLNRLLRAVFAAERHVLPRTSLPFGVSLLAIAERPAGSDPDPPPRSRSADPPPRSAGPPPRSADSPSPSASS